MPFGSILFRGARNEVSFSGSWQAPDLEDLGGGKNELNGLTIVDEAREEPPRFAMTGEVRWIKRKVVIKGAEY